MADFRKLLLALIAGALIFGTVAGAADFSCQVAGVPTLIRTEGVADYVGDVLLDCAGTLPSLSVTTGLVANIRLNFQPLNITSKDLDTRDNPGPTSEATLILDNAVWPDGTPHVKGYASTTGVLTPFADGSQNVYQAIRLNNNELEWQGVVLVGPGSATVNTPISRSIRMTNVRINAAGLGPNVPITVQVNITSPTSIPIFGNASVLVANTRLGLMASQTAFTAKNCDLSTIPPGSFDFTSEFVEGFGTSFKPRYNNYAGAAPHWVPGGGYFDESGYNPIGFGSAQIPGGGLDAGSSLVAVGAIGNATQGTRLSLKVTSIPSGLTISTPATITTSNGLVLTALAMSPASGAGPTVTLTWEVTGYAAPGTAQFLVDTVEVVVTASYGVPPVVGTALGHGRFLPNATVFTAVLESVAPVPRFVDSVNPNSVDGSVITITQNCKTLLLFPYVTSSAGYNTGIAISNTSVDPYGEANVTGQIGYPTPTFVQTKPQAGACTLYFYGQSNLTALTAAQHAQTIVSVPAGAQFVTNLAVGAKGFVYAQDGTKTAACDAAVTGNTCADMPTFAGYMIAACNFQWAHGFSFVTDTGSDRTMGYLALVIPDRGSVIGRLPQESSFQAGPNQGEQLGQ